MESKEIKHYKFPEGKYQINYRDRNKDVKLWEYLVKKLDNLNDNNYTARLIYNKVVKSYK